MKNLYERLLVAILILFWSNISAKLPQDAPALPPPEGNVVSITTWDELIDAVWNLQSNTTIFIQPGTYIIPEWWFINIGIDLNNPVENIVIRGATGDYNDVVIKGTAPGMTGASSFGFFINNASNVTIADLTVGEVYHHAVQLNPPSIGAADGIRLYHCRFYNTGEQLIKGNFLYDDNGLPAGVQNGRIEYCLLEYTSWGPEDGYTEGIDLHAADNWTIQHNLLRNIRVHENDNHTDVPAILIWNNSKNVDIIANTMINCDRGVAFGLYDRTLSAGYPEVQTGVIRNNMIYRQSDSVFYNDAGILAWDVRDVSILNNTILDEVKSYPPIEYRFTKENSNIVIANNLINNTLNGNRPPIWDRDNSGGNPEDDYKNATVEFNFINDSGEMFSLNYPGDLHLTENSASLLSGISSYTNCPDDFDATLRGGTTNYGADHVRSEITATHSFTNYDGGTHPNTITINGSSIIINLSAIANATVFRATINPGINFNYYDLTENPFYERTIGLSFNGIPLDLSAPRYRTFNATGPTIETLGNGSIMTLHIDEAGPGLGGHISLDVMCDVALPASIPQVTNTAATFLNGDALITFQEVDPPITVDNPSYLAFNNAYQNAKNGNIRYRIYRSTAPINSCSDIQSAEFIDEIFPLSGWNPKLDGPEKVFPYIGQNGNVSRLPVADEVIAGIGCGIYANHYQGISANETAYYFISHTVDGAEDFSTIVPGTNATTAVEEYHGPGAVLLREVRHLPNFLYEGASTLYFYTKWESPPAASFPNETSNYLIALRDNIDYSAFNPGITIKLHAWGGNLLGDYGWWYYADQGNMMVACNQFPWQNWWIGYHSSLGTLKSYEDGTVKPFTPYRILDFVFDFIAPNFDIDINKIVLSGSSMGASGTSMIGLRNGQIFSNIIGWVGVHSPGKSPTFEGSYENALGDSAWACKFSNVEFTAKYGGVEVKPEDNYNVWDYFDNSNWLAKNPTAELPWHTFSNGFNDDQIGWPQAREYVISSMSHKAPINFTWGLNGHSQRAEMLAPYGYETDRNSHLVFQRNQSYPVFTNSSSDNDLLTEEEGQINNYFFWDTESIIDTSDRWEMSLCLIPTSPYDSVTTNITPRRLQNLHVEPGSQCICLIYEGDELRLTQNVIADENGFASINNIVLNKTFRRIVLKPLIEQEFNIPSGWSGISTYTVPVNPNVEIMFENLQDRLIFLGDGTGYYRPQQGSNTLNYWNPNSGYLIKLTEPSLFQIEGTSGVNHNIQLAEGWNLIPVLVSEGVSCQDIFSQLGGAFVMAAEVAGLAVYWPDMGIYTLDELRPGKSYFIRVNQPINLNFDSR